MSVVVTLWLLLSQRRMIPLTNLWYSSPKTSPLVSSHWERKRLLKNEENKDDWYALFRYVQRMAEQQIPKAICIYQQSLTASAAKVEYSLGWYRQSNQLRLVYRFSNPCHQNIRLNSSKKTNCLSTLLITCWSQNMKCLLLSRKLLFYNDSKCIHVIGWSHCFIYIGSLVDWRKHNFLVYNILILWQDIMAWSVDR